MLSEKLPIDTVSQDPSEEPKRSGGLSRRAQLKYAGIALLGVLVFVVLPGYLALQPGFFGRFPDLSGKHGPWTTSTHATVGCGSCHVPPGSIARGVYRARLVGEFYQSLVIRSGTPGLFEKPTNEACLVCHSDLRSVSPKGDLRMPHRAHVNVLQMRCIQCHSFLVHEKSPTGKHSPPMAACLRCHNGDKAKNGCSVCHTRKSAPETHRAANWTIVHPQQAVVPGAPCEGCHKWTPNWCVDCHGRRPQSHTPDWRAVHGAQVRKHRSCEGCHKQDFCVKCHGEVPPLNFNPELKPVE